MRRIYLLSALLLTSFASTFAQECEVKIEILPEQYMHGIIKETSQETKNIEVEFSAEVMEAIIILDGKNYILTVVNDNCQAYCKKQNRVRQLHSGDEKLVKNLLKDRESDLIKQIKACKG